MKLSYRGVNYEHTKPTLEVTEGEILGKYRGTGWRCHTLKEVPVLQPNMALTYRGVNYETNPAAGACRHLSQGVEAPAGGRPSIFSRSLADRRANTDVHRANLKRNLERRLQAARERGDEQLVSLLEAESRQLVELH
jgi:hypothetical protein